jgi:hypothetical protein
MIKSWATRVLAVFVISLFGISSARPELTPREILRRADEARGNLEGVEWVFSIQSIEDGSQQQRGLKVKARGYNFLAVFTSPPKVKGQKILMIDHNMWFAKPGVRKPVPISPRQKLIGGAAYGDIAATNYSDDYEATPLPDEIVEGELCFTFDLKATTEKTTYDRIKYWISKERVVGVKGQYFTVSGKMFKSATFEYKNKVLIDNEQRPFISKMTITDAIKKDNITTLNFSEPTLKEVPYSTFDLNFLMMR